MALSRMSMAVRIRVNPAQGEKLAQDLPSIYSLQWGWVANPCQRRQPPKAGAEGQRLQGFVSRAQSTIEYWWPLHEDRPA
jgi:hypothetical protein